MKTKNFIAGIGDSTMKHVIKGSLLSLVLLGGGCSGGSSTMSPPIQRDGSSSLDAAALNTQTAIRLYVRNRGAAWITGYNTTANGNVTPVITIRGNLTQLDAHTGLAMNSSGRIYATNFQKVVEFAPGSNGNATPSAIISGSNTQMGNLTDVAVDSSSNVYVSDAAGYNVQGGQGTIKKYGAGSSGNVSPVAKITGNKTHLAAPYNITVDSSGKLYVSNQGIGGQNVLVFAAGSNGNVQPLATIGGSNTRIGGPCGVAVDALKNIWVTNCANSAAAILEFSPASNGNVSPIRKITGPATRLQSPRGVAIGTDGTITVSDNGATSAGELLSFPPKANGNATPVRVITGDQTLLQDPAEIVLH